MSNALAIAAVTATLKDLISDSLLGLDLSSIGSITVTATPPDRITTGQTEPNQLNLFLYQVTPNSGWRNQTLPTRDGSGQRLRNAPLALDLHYLLTAYGAQDLNAEALLGLAMLALHDTPGLDRARLRNALGPPNPPFGDFSALNLADQIESLKITPQYLGGEELSKLWTAMQARYRPSMAYQGSGVLMEAEAAARAAPPVLKRGADDRGPAARAAGAPRLESIRPAASELLRAARLGDALRIEGRNLQAADAELVFEHPRATAARTLPVAATASALALDAQLPAAGVDAGAMADWFAGFYAVRLRLAPADQPAIASAPIAMMLAPRVEVSPLNAAPGALALTLRCSPRLLPEQHAGVRVRFGGDELLADSIQTPADPEQPTTIEVTVPAALAVAGRYPVIVRVDGVESIAAVADDQGVFGFDPQQTVVIA